MISATSQRILGSSVSRSDPLSTQLPYTSRISLSSLRPSFSFMPLFAMLSSLSTEVISALYAVVACRAQHGHAWARKSRGALSTIHSPSLF